MILKSIISSVKPSGRMFNVVCVTSKTVVIKLGKYFV